MPNSIYKINGLIAFIRLINIYSNFEIFKIVFYLNFVINKIFFFFICNFFDFHTV